MKKGDRVFVKDEDIEGQIARIDGDKVWVLTSDGFEMYFLAKELVVADEAMLESPLFTASTEEIIREKESTDKVRKFKKPTKKGVLPPMEVDLHIEKLVDRSRGLSNFDILNLQMDTAKRQLEFAIRKRIPRIVFIHGIGEGILKSELESLFRKYDGIRHYEADARKYGAGATEVYIPQNTTVIPGKPG